MTSACWYYCPLLLAVVCMVAVAASPVMHHHHHQYELVLPPGHKLATETEDGTARSERSTNLSHIQGSGRKIRMYIKNKHLQIMPDGTINGTDDGSEYTIFQRESVNNGQVKIQGVASCMFLCMNSCGMVYGSREYTLDCVFNEQIEQHYYNTYSSARYSDKRRTFYLGLDKHGQPRKVQLRGVKTLGKLSTYARVLTQAPDIGSNARLRHHGLHYRPCPPVVLGGSDAAGRDKLRCRTKRKNKKKNKRKCNEGEEDEDCEDEEVDESCVDCTKKRPPTEKWKKKKCDDGECPRKGREAMNRRRCEKEEDDEQCKKRLQESRRRRRARMRDKGIEIVEGKKNKKKVITPQLIVGGRRRSQELEVATNLNTLAETITLPTEAAMMSSHIPPATFTAPWTSIDVWTTPYDNWTTSFDVPTTPTTESGEIGE